MRKTAHKRAANGSGAAKTRTRPRRSAAQNGRPLTTAAIDMGPLTSYVGYALRRAQIAAFSDFIASLRQLELRPAIFGILMVIDQNPGLPQSAVCAALGIQKANFVPLLNELVRRRLAVRHAGVADRRSYALHLTPDGRGLLNRARELHAEHESRMARRLGADGREHLLALLNRLTEPQEYRG
jgi:DNA-binding MarR family transcriptional regulator